MINKIIVDGENVELTDKSQVPFRHTFSQANTHTVRYGIDDTDEICAYAFMNCTELSYISFPDEIKNIKRGAFKGCTSLRALPLSENIEYIGREAFDGCTALEEIEFKSTEPPQVFCTLPSQTKIYVPNDSKYVYIPFTDMVLDGKTEYFTKNAYSGKYEKMVDVTFADENGTYFYNKWQDIANDAHSAEVKNRVPVESIEMYKEMTVYKGEDNTISYSLSPANITNNQLHWFLTGRPEEEVVTDINCTPVVDEVKNTVSGEIRIHTNANAGSRISLTAYAESGISYIMTLNVRER